MKKRLLGLSLALFLIFTSSVTVWAEELQGASGWQVTFDGKKMDSNFTSASIADEINAMQPGDSVELTITLKNDFDGKADWYIKNQVLQALEDAGNAAGGAYDYLLTYTDTTGKLTTLYSGEKFGGEGRYSGQGLHGVVSTLEDFFYLDRMGAHETGVVKLKVALEGETLVNNYQNTYVKLQLDFATEAVSGNAEDSENSTSSRRTRAVQTGDDSPILLYLTLALSSGLGLLVIVFFRLRRERNGKAELVVATPKRRRRG